MQLSHTRPVASAIFDDPNLVSCAGLVPIAAMVQKCGLKALTDEHLTVPTDKGAHAGAKVNALVAGMVAGADSIDDMRLLRHGAMATLFDRRYAPSTLGSFLREFTFGHVRQLDAVAARLLGRLHARTPLLAGLDGPVCVDLDDTIIEVHGYAKQGSGYGYSGIRGLNALIATVTTEHGAPVIAGQRLRKGVCGSPRGAGRMVADSLATVAPLRSPAATPAPLVRADSAFYGYPTEDPALGPSPPGAIRSHRCLVGAGRDGVQPHPRRGPPHRTQAGQGPHRDHPPPPDPRASTHRLLRPPPHPAPTTQLALGTRMENTVPQHL